MSSRGDLEEEIRCKISEKEKLNRLKKYVQHLPDCNLLSLIPIVSRNRKKVDCTCGLKEVLKGK